MGAQPAPSLPAPPALPPCFEWHVPRHWLVVDFVSDLHLGEDLPRTTDAFFEHLRGTPADAVVILGDLFELWVGDDMAARGHTKVLVERLAQAASRLPLAFMTGNRDFLAGTGLLVASGMTGLPDPTVCVFGHQRLLLSHGDALCVDDLPYQALRTTVRDPAWQAAFLAKPLDERMRFAADLRRASQGRGAFDGEPAVDVDMATAAAWLHAFGAAELVHGHTHRPASHGIAPGLKRHVLSDWDLDHGTRAEVLRLTLAGLRRVAPAGVAG